MNTTKTLIIRAMIFSIGLLVGGIGVSMLLPFLDGAETYTHTKKAFYLSIIFIASAGYYLALATTGFEGFKNSKVGRRIFTIQISNQNG